jgi:biotin carboxylase
MARVLLLLPTSSYRADAFLEAAKKLSVEAAVASDRCHKLAEIWPARDDLPIHLSLALDFQDPEGAAGEIARAAVEKRFDAIIPTSDETAVIAALAARKLGLRGSSPEATYAARNKRVMREKLQAAGVPCPRFEAFPVEVDPRAITPACGFPCVVKPLLLSGSRGVIRAEDRAIFVAAFERVAKLVRRPDVAPGEDPARGQILVEEYVPGVEVALEGIVEDGVLRTLAIFDKPDPLEGPFFEETIYVTPSRHGRGLQEAIARTASDAAAALGLREGPIHAELRISDGKPIVIEIAARSIGGLCSRTLRFSLDRSLEQVVLARALGLDGESPVTRGASGVMMIPIPRGGVLAGVSGEARARAVPGIEELAITTRIGEKLVPLPEGASYLGFIFARADRPDLVEAALRQSHACLSFTVAGLL